MTLMTAIKFSMQELNTDCTTLRIECIMQSRQTGQTRLTILSHPEWCRIQAQCCSLNCGANKVPHWAQSSRPQTILNVMFLLMPFSSWQHLQFSPHMHYCKSALTCGKGVLNTHTHTNKHAYTSPSGNNQHVKVQKTENFCWYYMCPQFFFYYVLLIDFFLTTIIYICTCHKKQL